MAKQLSLKEAKQRAGRFCALRERSPYEVLQKAKSWGLSETDQEKLVSDLIALNFISEERFANAYCNDKFEFNSWGRQKIRAHIYVHRISEKIVDGALARIDQTTYKKRIHALAKKKWEKHAAEGLLKQKQKTVSYLTNKGFELDLIWQSIGLLESTKGQS